MSVDVSDQQVGPIIIFLSTYWPDKLALTVVAFSMRRLVAGVFFMSEEKKSCRAGPICQSDLSLPRGMPCTD